MLQRFLDPAVLASIFARSCRQDCGRWFRRRAAPLPHFRFQPGIRRISPVRRGRRPSPCRLERLCAHRTHLPQALQGRNQLAALILLDTSASMTYTSGKITKLDYARYHRGIAHLSRLPAARRHGPDRLRSTTLRTTSPPSTRQGQLMRLLHAIEQRRRRHRAPTSPSPSSTSSSSCIAAASSSCSPISMTTRRPSRELSNRSAITAMKWYFPSARSERNRRRNFVTPCCCSTSKTIQRWKFRPNTPGTNTAPKSNTIWRARG